MSFNEEEYNFNDDDLNDIDFPSSESEDSDLEDKKVETNVNMKDRVKMIKMRSNINTLNANVKDKESKYKRIKEELSICDTHLTELKKEEEMTLAAIDTNKASGNLAAAYRLQGQLKRVMIEQEGEVDLQMVIKKKLTDAEREYINAQMDEEKYMHEDYNLKEEERKFQEIQENIQKQRLNKERILTKNTKKSLELKHGQILKSSQERETQQNELQQSIAEAHSKHAKYYQKTSKEKKDAMAAEEKKKLEQQRKTEQSLQKLNSDIVQTKENMTAINAKKRAEKLEELEKEKNIQLSAIEKGGNPKLELKKYKNSIKASDANEKFLMKVNEGKLKIAQKISGEERNMTKKKELMPYLFQEKKKSGKSVMAPIMDISSKKSLEDLKEFSQEEWERWDIRSSAGRSSANIVPGINTTRNMEDSSEILSENVQNLDKDEEDTNCPEFKGMWDTTIAYKVPKNSQNLPLKDEKASKMEQEIMQRVLLQLKDNIVQPQIVGGKLFKGKSFQSKPEVIQFENLEVGETYSKNITLTNTSYGTNQCRFERISEHLLDFISIRFSPPGPLSPGMTFDFTVTFEPKLDQDLYGEVFFTSQSERFSIPLICLTKKCKMRINKQFIKFNTSVIGETLLQSIILKNSGAKGTFCRMRNTSKEGIIDRESITKDEQGKDLPNYIHEEYESITTSLGDNKLWIDGYKEQEVIIKWSPIIAGDDIENFFVSFEDEDNEGFNVQVQAKAIDVPVYITDPIISMDICMVDRLYQDTIVFHSRAATALKMTFNVPNEIQNYLEILPNMGFIQAGQEFKAQLKLVVKSSIYNENCPFFDSNTGILDVPISASIANQVKTVDFNVQAVLTVTDLEIVSQGSDPSLIDFGFCTINETKIKSLKIFNKSILAQEFGFTGYPEYVEIQPNHGYGIILPKEELEFKVMFSPKKAENFRFQVRCQTLIDRSFALSCTGVGVHPTLEFSKQIIAFPHTAVNDTSSIDVFLVNNHTSTNIYTHEPPRIGTGPVIPVGPKTYNIILPEHVPVSIHPRVGTIAPGEKKKLTLFFKPKLSDDAIKKEAAEVICSLLESEAKKKWEEEIKDLENQMKSDSSPTLQQQSEKTEEKGKKSSKKPARPASDKRKSEDLLEELVKGGPSKIVKVEPEQIIVDSEEYLKAKLSLLKKFDFNFEMIKVKCLIADGSMSEPDKLNYDFRNTLSLELHCPCVRPDLVILSNDGRSTLDFGDNILNHRITKIVSVQNISSDVIQLKATDLDPNGAFQICNALREVEPNGVLNIVVSFCTQSEGIYESNWSISGKKRTKTINLRFRAVAINPKVEIKEVKDGVLKVGIVMVNEYVEKPLTLVNNSVVDIQYNINLSAHEEFSPSVGVSNMSGLSPFSLTPCTGIIPAGKTQIVTLSFAPDHASSNFKVLGTLVLFEKVQFLNFSIEGESKSNVLYLKKSGENIERSLEYLGQTWAVTDQQNEDNSLIPNHEDRIVLILKSSLSDKGEVVEGKGVFLIGYVRTMAVSQKKNGEFSVDNMNILTSQGFNVDFPKGQIEADSEKEITVSWIPSPQYEIGTVLSSSINITLKGDTSSSQVIELRAYVK